MQVNGLLTELGAASSTDKATYHNFTPIYERFLYDKRDTMSQMVEIGIANGSSIKMWDMYLPKCKILGLDINTSYLNKYSYSDKVTLEVCDATDTNALMSVFSKNSILPGTVDLFIDDASHRVSDHKKIMFNGWKYVKPGGLYIIEDMHTAVLDLIGRHQHIEDDKGYIDVKPETEKLVLATMYGYKNLFPGVNADEIEHIAYVSNVKTMSLTCIFTKRRTNH